MPELKELVPVTIGSTSPVAGSSSVLQVAMSALLVTGVTDRSAAVSIAPGVALLVSAVISSTPEAEASGADVASAVTSVTTPVTSTV